MSRCSYLSRYNHSRTPRGIRENCEKFQITSELLEGFESIVTKFTPETLNYYSGCALTFDPHQLTRRKEIRYLYLYSFLKHQQNIFQDVLIDTILLTCQGRESVWIKQKKEQLYQTFQQHQSWTRKLSRTVSEQEVLIDSFISIISNEELDPLEKLAQLETIAGSVRQDTEVKADVVSNKYTNEQSLIPNRYHYEESDSKYLQHRVSGPLKQFQFDSETSDIDLMKAVSHFQDKDGAVSSNAPTEFLSEKEQNEITSRKKFPISLYKVFLFKSVIRGLKSGTLNCLNSYKYASFDSYLIDKNRWEKEKLNLLLKAGLTEWIDLKDELQQLRTTLQRQHEYTEFGISDGINKSVRFDKKDNPVISTPPQEKSDTNGLVELFPRHSSVSLYQILSTVDQKCSFTEQLEHLYRKNRKKSVSPTSLLASIIGYGCNIGISRMGICFGIYQQKILNTLLNGIYRKRIFYRQILHYSLLQKNLRFQNSTNVINRRITQVVMARSSPFRLTLFTLVILINILGHKRVSAFIVLSMSLTSCFIQR